MSSLIILDRTGHSQLDWSPKNKAAIKEAQERFKKMLSAGYVAYKTDKDGQNGKSIKAFDETAERIHMQPQLIGG